MGDLMTLARMQRRGLFALIAGISLLVGQPLYQGLVLAPTGYLDAIKPISNGHFGPFLVWASAHNGLDIGFHLLELLPPVLALGLRGALRRVLWPNDPLRGRAAMALGQFGFATWTAGVVILLVATPSMSDAYAHAGAHRPSIEQSFMGLYVFDALLRNVLAFGLIAAFLLLTAQQGMATGRLPSWLAYLGLASAGLLGATAALSVFSFTAPAVTTVASFAFLALALWFIVQGMLLVRIQMRPLAAAEASAQPVEPPTHTP
jgi:hypothetical protein